MSGTVLSRTDRHTQHSSGAARSATALRRTASVPPSSSAPAVARPSGGDPSSDTDAAEADPATSALVVPPLPAPPDVTTRHPGQVGDPGSTTVAPGPNRTDPNPAGPSPADPDPTGPEPAGPELAGPSLAPPAEPTAALTVTLAIPLTGEALTPQTRRLLDALRELVELGQGAVTTTAVSSQSGAPDSAAFALPVQPGRHSSAFAAPTPDLTDAGSADGAAGRNGALVDGGWPDTDRIVFDGVGAPDADVPGPRVRPSANPTEVRLLTASRQVLIGGQPMAMTRLEFDLLLFLAGNPRRVFTRAQLLGAVWGYEHTGERTVDVHVRRLRVKMGVQVPLITTVYGVGYRLDDDARIVVVAHE